MQHNSCMAHILLCEQGVVLGCEPVTGLVCQPRPEDPDASPLHLLAQARRGASYPFRWGETGPPPARCPGASSVSPYGYRGCTHSDSPNAAPSAPPAFSFISVMAGRRGRHGVPPNCAQAQHYVPCLSLHAICVGLDAASGLIYGCQL